MLAPAAETGDVDAEDAAGAGDAGEPGEAVDEEQHLVHGDPVRRWDWGTRLPTGLRSMRCNHHTLPRGRALRQEPWPSAKGNGILGGVLHMKL